MSKAWGMLHPDGALPATGVRHIYLIGSNNIDNLYYQLQDRLIGMALDNAAEDEAVAKDLHCAPLGGKR